MARMRVSSWVWNKVLNLYLVRYSDHVGGRPSYDVIVLSPVPFPNVTTDDVIESPCGKRSDVIAVPLVTSRSVASRSYGDVVFRDSRPEKT